MTLTPPRLQAVDDSGRAPEWIVERVLARQDRIDPRARATWQRLLALLAARRDDLASDQLCAVLADLVGIEPVPGTATARARVRDLIEVATHGTVDEWRSRLSAVAASPWGTDVDHLLRLARRSDSPALQVAMEEVVTLCRELRRLDERTQVARHIRECVARSGVSQREFAAWVGTSPSRLSTYASGRVVPSATMLLRIRRASRALDQRSADEISSSRGA